MPIKSLARFLCVSKPWCGYIDDPYLAILHGERTVEEPTHIILHKNPTRPNLQRIQKLRVIESKECITVSDAKRDPVLEFDQISTNLVKVCGSCNGLLYYLCDSLLIVVHPLRKECYQLPSISTGSLGKLEDSFGLGFDASTNTFKMVCVVRKDNGMQPNVDLITTVHVLGTDSWRQIPQVPPYPICSEGVFAHGCLHWLVDDYKWPSDKVREIIRFDVSKEEFGLISLPREKPSAFWRFDKLVDLHGDVGYVYNNIYNFELWVLKQKEWKMHCWFYVQPPMSCRSMISVLGYWNKDGDILVSTVNSNMFYVYRLKTKMFDVVKIVGHDGGCDADIRMYQANLLTIHGINKKC